MAELFKELTENSKSARFRNRSLRHVAGLANGTTPCPTQSRCCKGRETASESGRYRLSSGSEARRMAPRFCVTRRAVELERLHRSAGPRSLHTRAAASCRDGRQHAARYGVSSGDSISGKSSAVARFSSRRMVSEEKPARSKVR